VELQTELQKMGYSETKNVAAVFTQTLSKLLEMETQRYFVCIAHRPSIKVIPALPTKFIAPNVHVLDMMVSSQRFPRKPKILAELAKSCCANVAHRIEKDFPATRELMMESQNPDVLIVKNGSMASFADLLIVNNLTMGHPNYTQQNPHASQYREVLLQVLGRP
jgi:hypothetical protein